MSDTHQLQIQLFDRNEPPPPPGEFIQAELDKRGWVQADLAKIIGRPLPTVNEIIQGKKQITPETAYDLAQAFNTTPDFWMAKEAGYRLSLVGRTRNDISDRARVFEIAPIKEMERRNWIRQCDSMNELESELCRFFEVKSLGDSPRLAVNARSANSAEGVNTHQLAWCYRALKLARTLHVNQYDESRLPELKKALRNLSLLARGAEDVPTVLGEFGIRFVVVEGLRQSKIDGAAFWMDANSPVIAMAMRYDRIDYFWFTLMHELSHIEHRDTSPVDSEIEDASSTSPIEERANKEAAAALISPTELSSFITRSYPHFSKVGIIQFANRIKAHPGVVTGQLHHRKALNYKSGRAMLVKVRDFLCARALTDGFGFSLPTLTNT